MAVTGGERVSFNESSDFLNLLISVLSIAALVPA